MKNNSKIPAAVTGTLIMALMTFGAILWSENGTGLPQSIECLFDIKELDNSTTGLVTGYNYQLLKEYAESRDMDFKARICSPDEMPLDSLSAKKADILVLPSSSTITGGKPLCSCHIDSLTQWVASRHSRKLIEDMQAWVEEQTLSEDHQNVRKKYFTRLNPFKRRSGQSFISPYDDLLKSNAESIGWDWRMLAAIAWQESHFRMDVKSHRGAVGVMQMKPSTAAELGFDDIVDPSSGIEAGAKHLKRLYSLFKDIPDEQERLKFTIASYNAGEGRIMGCIDYAVSKELEGNTWNEIVSLIPEMEEFKGEETVAYVDSVLAVHQEFCRICR